MASSSGHHRQIDTPLLEDLGATLAVFVLLAGLVAVRLLPMLL
ncbi:MAG: hypothetical protein WEB00_13660 [Dehalococcoidia bacterium]